MLGAGQRPHRVRFERRGPRVDDGYGNEREAWASLGLVWAAIRPKFGREKLAADRLEGGFQASVTVLAFVMTKGLTEADRIVVATGPYAGRVLDIVSIVPSPDAREIELLVSEAAGV